MTVVRPHITERPRVIQRGMIPNVSFRHARNDDQLLGGVLRGKSWLPWDVLLLSAFGEQLTESELVLYKQLTNRSHAPDERVEEAAFVVGRRGGKSRAVSLAAVYIATLCQHRMLAPGETGVVLVIAPDTQQAAIVLDYCEAVLRQSPVLSQLIEARVERELRLNNGVTISVRASDFRRLRGPTYLAVIADEVAFWFNENSANPDDEILNAVRPGLATTGGPLFLISSPYARRGVLWDLYRRHYGPAGDDAILVAKAPSRTMNNTLRRSVVDRAMERDESSARAEYLAEFRSDLEQFVSIEAVKACVSTGIRERAQSSGHAYSAFCDPSGGSQDSFTLAIAHRDWINRAITIDCIREIKPPFAPTAVVAELANVLKTYNVSTVESDRYAGAWPVEAFGQHGIRCIQSAKAKSDLYVDLLALLNSRRVHLLDNPKLINQLVGLERRTARSGKDSIDHAPGGHDDIANAVAGVGQLMHKASYDTRYEGWQDVGPLVTDRGLPIDCGQIFW
jgi:hypothetical protein